MKKLLANFMGEKLPANLLEQVRAERIRRERERAFQHYEDYLIYSHHGRWKPARHLKMICELLESVERGELKKLILTLPPRHGKSMSVTESFPSWYLGRHPDRRVIEASYGADLAKQFGRANRSKLEEFGMEIFGVTVDPKNSSVTDWGILGRSGGMLSVGIGGGITGKGADIFIVDDPVKNWKEAFSETTRESIWNEWTASILTRIHADGAIIIIATRWHEDDLVGRILEQDKTEGEWTVLNIPCEAEEPKEGEEPDPLGREPGEPLWPEQGYDAEWLAKKKRDVGAKAWESLYQGHPTPGQGFLFKRQYFKSFREHWNGKEATYELITTGGSKLWPASLCKVFQTCDVAGSTKTSADYFCLGTFALTPDNELLILDMFRARMEGPDQPDFIQQQYLARRPLMVGVESKNMGLTLFQSLVRMGLPIVELKPDADKFTRAMPAAARYSTGTIYHPVHATWLDDAESELCAFPHGAHDDQVDVVAYAVLMSIWGYLDVETTESDRALIIG